MLGLILQFRRLLPVRRCERCGVRIGSDRRRRFCQPCALLERRARERLRDHRRVRDETRPCESCGKVRIVGRGHSYAPLCLSCSARLRGQSCSVPWRSCVACSRAFIAHRGSLACSHCRESSRWRHGNHRRHERRAPAAAAARAARLARLERVRELRERGYGAKRIARALGISVSRAKQLIREAETAQEVGAGSFAGPATPPTTPPVKEYLRAGFGREV